MPTILKPVSFAIFDEMRSFPIENRLLIDEKVCFSMLGMPKILKSVSFAFYNEMRSFPIENRLLIDRKLGFSWFQLVSVACLKY